ncbi:MAG: tRNA lysidine(34) synthetase TilS, partial [Lacipirellulaceae bacterium]
FLATAHHRDDQVETILFRLLRGTGLRGLRGMSRARPLSPSVTLMRPMLNCTREEILDYLASIDQPFREDASNADNAFSRNRLRNDLLPLLREEFNQGIVDALMRLSRQAGETYELVEQQARKLYEKCRLKDGEDQRHGFTLSVSSLLDRSDTLVIEVLRLAWREIGFPEQGMTDATWRLLAELCQCVHDDKKHSLPANLLAQCDGRELRVYKAKQ